jgi:hypothetical protein
MVRSAHQRASRTIEPQAQTAPRPCCGTVRTRGLMVRDACLWHAPHHEGLESAVNPQPNPHGPERASHDRGLPHTSWSGARISPWRFAVSPAVMVRSAHQRASRTIEPQARTAPRPCCGTVRTRGLMVRDACLWHAPHHEGLEPAMNPQPNPDGEERVSHPGGLPHHQPSW